MVGDHCIVFCVCDVHETVWRVNVPVCATGRVPASKRFGVANTFNTDPSYDVLLLTTSIGGLGLTLTGADTVIMYDHAWNPMADLQAMDRTHRLGQKRTVSVYRLITRGTLEEKIMRFVASPMHLCTRMNTPHRPFDVGRDLLCAVCNGSRNTLRAPL